MTSTPATPAARPDGFTGMERPSINWGLLSATRFALAFIVTQFHQAEFFEKTPFNSVLWQLGGKASVVGFLFISGFSIHASLAKQRHGFVRRRLLRIYPAYLVALLAAFLLEARLGAFAAPGGGFEPSSGGLYLCNLVMLQMFACKAVAYDGVIWSLSIECSFYLLSLGLHLVDRRLIYAAIVVSMLILCLPPGAIDHPAYLLLTKFNAGKYLWAYLIGYLAYEIRHPLAYAGAALAAGLTFMLSPLAVESLGPLTIAATLGVIWLARQGKGPRLPWLDMLGDISSPLYLIHLPDYIALAGLAGITTPWLTTATALIAATIIVLAIERPAHMWAKPLTR